MFEYYTVEQMTQTVVRKCLYNMNIHIIATHSPERGSDHWFLSWNPDVGTSTFRPDCLHAACPISAGKQFLSYDIVFYSN